MNAAATFILDRKDNTIVVAWKRAEMVKLVNIIYQSFGGNLDDIPTTLPDHDNMYVLTMVQGKGKINVRFNIVAENLNQQSDVCLK